MTKELRAIPFSTFLYATLVGHLVYAVPTIGALLLFDLMDAKPLLFIILFVDIVSIPYLAAQAWLIAKGSNWVNAPLAMTVACALPAALHGLLFGGWLGFRLFGPLGGVIGAILLFLVARTTRVALGKFITRRFLLITQPAKI